jgi:hypothetical protein
MRLLNRFKFAFLSLTFVASCGLSAMPATVHAQAGAIKKGASGASGESGDNPSQTLNGVVKNIVNLISVIIGFVAVFMIIFAGFRYVTSGGDSTAISNSKNTLLYAIIGLVIVGLAQFIAQFVLTKGNILPN